MKEGIEALNFFLGDWVLHAKHVDTEGNWVSDPDGSATFKSILNDKGIQEDALFYFQGVAFKTRTLIGYDEQRQLFRFAILDDQTGFLDVQDGQFEEGALVISNLTTGTAFLRSGQEYHYRVTYESLNSSEIRMSIFLSLDGGSSWQKVNETLYVKKI